MRRNIASWYVAAVVMFAAAGGCASAHHVPMSAAVVDADTVLTIPFQAFHGFILVPMALRGQHGPMVLNTGASLVSNLEPLRHRIRNGVDTVTQTNPSTGTPLTVSATLRAEDGNLVLVSHDVLTQYPLREYVGTPVLGILSLPAMFPYETIVDYRNSQITFVPLDSLGRRAVSVHAYVPRATVALEEQRDSSGNRHYFIATHVGDSLVTMELDVGAPRNTLSHRTGHWASMHLQTVGRETEWPDVFPGDIVRLDHLSVARQQYDSLSFRVPDTTAVAFTASDHDLLGGPFFEASRVIGINLRTKELIFYK